MYSEARKLHIIEEALKINSDATLSTVEKFVKKSQKTIAAKNELGLVNFRVFGLTKKLTKWRG